MTAIEENKEHFSAFIKVLADRYNPLYIYCFGEHMDCSSKSGCFTAAVTSENYRYYLLMVVERETRIEHPVQDYTNTHFHHGNITILVHGKEAITQAIMANNRFFITVANKGRLVYSYDPTVKSFQVPSYIPTKAAEKSRRHHQRQMTLAAEFLESASGCLQNGTYHLCIFMLHQVVEQCCISLIRVFLAYRADIHNLHRLLRICDIFSPAPSALFLGESGEGRRLFDLLVRSYCAARYNDNFGVEHADAEKLFQQVSAFIKLTTDLCLEKIDSLAMEGEQYKRLKAE